MKSVLLNLWAWLLLHPVEVTAFLASVLGAIGAATVANARASGKPVGWFARFVDALAIRTRQGAQNAGWSWPLLGRSVFEAAIAASLPQPIEPDVSAAQTSSVYVYREGNEWIATPRTKSPILARGRTPDEAKEALRALLAERETIAPDASGPRSSAGYAESAVLRVIGGAALLALGVALLTGCSPTLPADLYRGVGVGVAVTARGGRELALLEARECLAKPSRGEAEACLVPWRARWVAISAAWQGAASSAQSLAHVVRSVDASLERRWPAMDAGAVIADAGASDAEASESNEP